MYTQQTKIRGLLLVATAIVALALPALAGTTTPLSRGASAGTTPLSRAARGAMPLSRGAGVATSPVSRGARVGTSRPSGLATRFATGQWG